MTSTDRHDSRLKQRYGKWAVVTGASEGIGREFAVQLARAKLNLVLVARREGLLATLARELSQAHGIETLTVPLDLASASSAAALAERVRRLEVGLFVAAAGFGTSGPFLANSLDDELTMIDVNCRAVAALTHAFARRFAEQRRGGIVLLSSLLAFQGVPRAANYAATKAYIQTLAEGLRQELEPLGVDVIASAPGPVLSGFGKRSNMVMGMGLPPAAVASGTLAALGRVGTVRPGWLSRLLELSLSFLPRSGRVRALGRVMQGMTRHQSLPPQTATALPDSATGGSGR